MQKKIIQRNVKDKKSEAVKDQLTKKKADQSRFTGKKSVVQELVKDEPVKKGPETGSGYLIAGDGRIEDLKKEVLYQLLGPVFFGDTVFHSEKELIHFFKEQYGIDVQKDFYEGDAHYEEYAEAKEAIAEGMMVYGGHISFQETALAELAEQIWNRLEKEGETGFRRINTLLEE